MAIMGIGYKSVKWLPHYPRAFAKDGDCYLGSEVRMQVCSQRGVRGLR